MSESLSDVRRSTFPLEGDSWESIAERELQGEDPAAAVSALQSWNLHVFRRPGAPAGSARAGNPILPSDVIFLEAPLAPQAQQATRTVEEAVIAGARGAAAHEGVVELVITLKHPNGGLSEVALDQPAATALLSACDAQRTEELMGHSWSKVRDALSVSWNRFNPARIDNE